MHLVPQPNAAASARLCLLCQPWHLPFRGSEGVVGLQVFGHARLQGSTPLGLGNSSQLRSVAVSKASRCIMEQKPSYEFKSP